MPLHTVIISMEEIKQHKSKDFFQNSESVLKTQDLTGNQYFQDYKAKLTHTHSKQTKTTHPNAIKENKGKTQRLVHLSEHQV